MGPGLPAGAGAEPAGPAVLITGCRPKVNPQVERLLTERVSAVHDKPFDMPRLLATQQHPVRAVGPSPRDSER